MRNVRQLQGLVRTIHRDGANDPDVLKHVIIILADHVIDLQRELDDLRGIATRADRNARLGMGMAGRR